MRTKTMWHATPDVRWRFSRPRRRRAIVMAFFARALLACALGLSTVVLPVSAAEPSVVSEVTTATIPQDSAPATISVGDASGTVTPVGAAATSSVATATTSVATATPLPFVRIQENSGRFAYMGPWRQSASSSLSGGTDRSVAATGALFAVRFNGSAIRLVGALGPAYGLADVYLDGTRVAAVDQSAMTAVTRRVLWTSPSLASGIHQLEVVSLGQRGSRASGLRVNVDAVDVRGSVLMPAPPTGCIRVEERDSRLTLFGAWSALTDANASGGAYRTSGVNGSGVMLAFTGTAFSLAGPVGPSLGRGYVYVDGGYVGSTDQRSAVLRQHQLLFSSVGLANVAHLVEVVPQAAMTVLNRLALDAIYLNGWIATSPRRIEERDARVGRGGPWVTTPLKGTSGDAYALCRTGGGSVALTFTGSRVRVLGVRSPTGGEAEVFLDGQSRGIVSLYASTLRAQQIVWQTSGLASAEHVLELRALGTASSASRGEGIGIDAFDVWGSVSATSSPPLFSPVEEDDARLSTAGTWQMASNASMSSRRFAISDDAYGVLTVFFQGTGMRWLGPRSAAYGLAEIVVDGASWGTVSQFATTSVYRREIWSIEGLPAGTHAVQIRVASPADSRGIRKAVAVDALHVIGGVLLEAPRPSGRARYASSDSRAARTGAWSATGVTTGALAELRTRDVRNRYDVSFEGTSVAWIGSRGPNYGIAHVLLDGTTAAQVDLYDYALHPGRVLWSASDLTPGRHRLSIRLSGRRRAASSSFFVGVQGLDISGVLLRTAATFEQDDWRLVYAGRWSARVTTVTPDTVMASTQASSMLTIRFAGTRLRLIAPRGPSSGIASISVDGARYRGCDLYSAELAGNRVIFDTGTLASGTHTVRVLVTGRRNPLAIGSEVAIDGFEVFGGGPVPQTAVQKARARTVDTALAQIGKRYVWGGAGPTVFDCSGLVMYSYRAAGIYLPHYSGYQWRLCSPKTSAQLLPGDLCFTDSPSYIHHVGMYIGDGITINAPGSGRYVEYRPVTTYGCFGRLRTALWPR